MIFASSLSDWDKVQYLSDRVLHLMQLVQVA